VTGSQRAAPSCAYTLCDGRARSRGARLPAARPNTAAARARVYSGSAVRRLRLTHSRACTIAACDDATRWLSPLALAASRRRSAASLAATVASLLRSACAGAGGVSQSGGWGERVCCGGSLLAATQVGWAGLGCHVVLDLEDGRGVRGVVWHVVWRGRSLIGSEPHSSQLLCVCARAGRCARPRLCVLPHGR